MTLASLTPVVCTIAIAGAAVGVLCAQGRGAVAAKKLPAGAVAQAEQAIDKAAAAKHLTLSPSAKQALATEVIRQEAAKAAPDVDAATSSVKVDQLLAPLATLPAQSTISLQAATTLVVQDKNRQVTSTLSDDIARHVKDRGQPVTEPVRAQMLQDLTTQSDALSKSGLSVDVIRARNEATLTAIDHAIGEKPITPQTYQTAMAEIFTKQVLMDIASTPDGASVAVEGVDLGKTNISGKPFEPGKSYTFTFTLAGYQPATRAYYVTPGLDTDSITEPLTTASDDLKVETKDDVVSTTTSSTSTTVVLLTVGVLVLVSLIVVVARRRR